MNENNPLIHSAMQIILHAGDARLNLSDAVKAASESDFSKAAAQMAEAEENINKAHESQTEIIQNEMAGENYEPCILFTHAQDTLMTIMSEMKFSREIIALYQRVSALERGEGHGQQIS